MRNIAPQSGSFPFLSSPLLSFSFSPFLFLFLFIYFSLTTLAFVGWTWKKRRVVSVEGSLSFLFAFSSGLG
jgi:hypothetical protein